MPEEIAILFGLGIGATTIIALTWIFTRFLLERRIPRRDPAEDATTRRELEDMRGRLESVEERLDFAERLLTKQKQQPGLGQGG